MINLQVWTLACMAFTNVIIQVWTDCESAPASFDWTTKGLHPLMESQVLPEMRRLRVRLSANFAQILTRTCRRLMYSASWCFSRCFRDALWRLSDSFRLRFLLMLVAEVFNKRWCMRELNWATLAGEEKRARQQFNARKEVMVRVAVESKVNEFSNKLKALNSPMLKKLFQSSKLVFTNIADPNTREIFEWITEISKLDALDAAMQKNFLQIQTFQLTLAALKSIRRRMLRNVKAHRL